MFCPKCGRPINENSNFCGGCGMSRADILNSIKKVNDTAVNPQPSVNNEPIIPVVNSEPAVTEVKTEIPVQPVSDGAVDVKFKEVLNSEAVEPEMPKTETTEPAPEAPKAEPVAETPKAEEPKLENITASYTWNGNNNQSNANAGYTNAGYTSVNSDYGYAQQSGYVAPPDNEKPLTTVDFIWVMLISSIPVIGLIYIIYLAIQNNNINKRSYARAGLIISAFAFVIVFVFMVGLFMSGIY